MTSPRSRTLLGKWRITDADLWERGFLDLVEPAYAQFDADGRGELVYGAFQATLECETAPSIIVFRFEGSDDMDPVSGTGSAELADDGSLELEISCDNGDDAVLKAHRR